MLQLKQMVNTLNSKLQNLIVTQQIVYAMTELSVCHQHCSRVLSKNPMNKVVLSHDFRLFSDITLSD